ncbi:MAG: hypothetical protein A4S09_00390 [Proteobacteria bacterium SG_bin7]|nr:MAG: hypothetical protein A4S09_00390 [Proteobacteria bacterium SG_bin7]
MTSESVSVVIPTLNRSDCLYQTVVDLLAQTWGNFEIVIVDQSAERDEKVISLLKKIDRRDITVKYYLVNFKGLPKARNFGWKNSQGNIIIFIDDDVRLPRHFVNEHIKSHRNERVEIVAGGIDEAHRPENNNPSRTGQFNFWTVKPYRDFNSHNEQFIDHAPGGNFSIKLSALKNVKGFDESLGLGAGLFEESDFCLRVKKEKGEIFFNPSARLKHLAHPTGGCRVDEVPHYLWSLTRNATIVMLRHSQIYQMPIASLRILLYIFSYFRQAPGLSTVFGGFRGIWDGLTAAQKPVESSSFQSNQIRETFQS